MTEQGGVTPDRIMQVGTGFMASKVLLVAIRMGLFTELAKGRRSAGEIQRMFGLHDRSLYDFLDALVALGFLEREGLKKDAVYRNAPDADTFLDRNKPTYTGGMLEMANDRLYRFWGDLEEGLRTGEPQNEVKREGVDIFDKLYDEPERLEQFINAMASVQMGAFAAFVEKFDFAKYRTLCDMGGASGALSIQVARRHGHMRCITVDLPVVEPIARSAIREAGLGDRIEARSLDFWEDDFPAADVLTMGNILHDWDLERKRILVAKAHAALNDGGAFVVIENIIDDDRRENAFGLLVSLTMLIETRGGYDFTGADFADLAREADFRKSEVVPLAGPASAAIAYK